MSQLRAGAFVFCLLCLIAVSGCGGGSNDSNSTGNPTISNFAASPGIASPGQVVNFSWATDNATAFTVSPSIGQNLPLNTSSYPYDTTGTKQTTTFTAVASTSSGQSAPSSVVLSIIPVTLSASPMTISAGGTTTLSYGGPNNGSSWSLIKVGNNAPIPLPAPSCSGNSCLGSYTTGPLSKTAIFQVAATGPAGGQALSPQVTVTVVNGPPVVTSFEASPAIAGPGQFVNFSWSTTNATAFNVTPAINQDEQTLPVNSNAYSYNTNGLMKTTKFVAVASSGSTQSPPVSLTLTMVPVGLSASATNIEAGQSVTLTYTGPNNGSSWSLVTIGNNNPMQLPTPSCSGDSCTGSYSTGPLSSNTTFEVAVAGPAGGQSYSPQVTITVGNPTTLIFTADPTTVPPGGAVTLSWQTQNASAVSIDHGIGNVTPVDKGSYCCVHPTQTTTYTATATSIYKGASAVTATATVTVNSGGLSNINHIIFMLQENRSFDNYFGVLAEYRVNHQPPIQGARLSDVNDLHTLPPGYEIKNPDNQSFGPFHARTECIENLTPAWNETHYDMDLVGDDWLHLTDKSQYLMDRFLDTTLPSQYDPTDTRPLGYYDQTDLPFYYELATQFTTSDTWYSPVAANTVPNRMYLFAATSYGHGYPPTDPNDPAWQRPTIFRALTDAGITWRYYYQDNSVFLANWADWNDPQIQGNVRNIQEYYDILASPSADKDLPQVVFIERAGATGLDEHPENNVQTGAADVQKALNALFHSKAWPDSAFILTYDEGGGLFDHVGPILVTPPDDQLPNDLMGHGAYIPGYFNVTGFRVPVIVVSPWSKPHTVVHLPTDYTSILKLIEDRFNVPALTQRDLSTGDMADPINGFFDFSAPNLLTVPPLPTQPVNGTCNEQLEGHP
jgi:phospholipase C